ncbi:MAG: FG-GAP-like repeat-containing protein [Acidobacteriota bacterium]|nr:CRTAC1 family protein [Blastocatellia bacterium]MDW8239717.1 FG-GAP-like repeat-containing protein [Acidobacteriota bacterium]
MLKCRSFFISLIVALSTFLMLSGNLPTTSSMSGAVALRSPLQNVITIVTPPEELIIGRNPLTIEGVVTDPSISVVYVIRVGAPVVILGRRRDELPGVPFPVINGRFTASVSFLAEGVNTIRVTGIDGNGRQHVTEVEAELYQALDRPPEVEIELIPNKRRQPIGETVQVRCLLRNNSFNPIQGTYDLSMQLPTGDMVMPILGAPFNLPAGRQETRLEVIRLSEYTAEPGYCRILGVVKNSNGDVLSQDEFYVETYRPDDFPFIDISKAAGITHQLVARGGLAAGAAFADYNNDGWLDLFVTDRGRNFLYRNNGNGTFTDVARSAGVVGRQDVLYRAAAWGDYDNDGFRDLFVTTKPGPDILYRNNGDGTFTNVTTLAGVGGSVGDDSSCAAWGDYNNDGFIDLYVGNDAGGPAAPGFVGAPGQPNYLYRNNGNGTFTEVGRAYGVNNWGRTFAALWTDYDNDGDVDLAVINDFGQFNDFPNTLYRNDGPDGRGGWKFTEVGPTVGFNSRLYGMGVGAGDVDNDGDLDYFISNCGTGAFHKNNGDGTFTEATYEAGLDTAVPPIGPFAGTDWLICTWGINAWDFDLDGWVDYYVTAGVVGDSGNFKIALTQHNLLFHNRQDGTFTVVGHLYGVDYPGYTRGATFGDIDNDGDLDIYLANIGEEGVLLRNDLSTGHNWLSIRLVGTLSNRDAFGAKIFVTTGSGRQMREVPGADMQLSLNSLEQVFGLGNHTQADVEVRWPRGAVQRLTNVQANQKLVITEPRS